MLVVLLELIFEMINHEYKESMLGDLVSTAMQYGMFYKTYQAYESGNEMMSYLFFMCAAVTEFGKNFFRNEQRKSILEQTLENHLNKPEIE